MKSLLLGVQVGWIYLRIDIMSAGREYGLSGMGRRDDWDSSFLGLEEYDYSYFFPPQLVGRTGLRGEGWKRVPLGMNNRTYRDRNGCLEVAFAVHMG